jgi:hypothetical protein
VLRHGKPSSLHNGFNFRVHAIGQLVNSKFVELMERLYLFLPSFDSCKDSVGFRDPDERFGVGIGLSDEAIDGGLEIIDGSETRV